VEHKELNDTFSAIHAEMAALLLERIQSGEATPSELNVARQLLKDNHIDLAAKAPSPLRDIAEILPFEDRETPIAQ
jgi:hypothetical protein